MIWKLTKTLTRNSPRIFVFHRFSESDQLGRTSRSEFSTFLDIVGESFEFCTVSDIVLRSRATHRSHKPLAAITIDDGYEDFFDVALPELINRDAPATLYITAQPVEQETWQWWDALEYLIRNSPSRRISVNLNATTQTFLLEDAPSRRAAWSTIGDALVLDNVSRRSVIKELEVAVGKTLPEKPTEGYSPMSWQQVSLALQAGVEIGGHTMTHAYLPSLDRAQLNFELTDSKKLIKRRLGYEVRSFAYPNGMPDDHSRGAVASVIEAGYHSAVVAYPRQFDASNPFLLGRWTARTTDERFKYVLNGASEIKQRLIGRK